VPNGRLTGRRERRARPASGTLIGIEHADVKTRHFLARTAAVVTAAAAIGMVLGPARADAADHEPDGSANRGLRSSMAEELGGRLDGWANRDMDLSSSALWSSVAEELGGRLDGWDNRDMDLSSSDLWEAMAFGIGSILDGWGNRDMDIGAF
jgi:hypothetical protein